MDYSDTFLRISINAATLGLTWIVGQRVVAYWTARQKRKELQLKLSTKFYESYCIFRTVWKNWNYNLRHHLDPKNISWNDNNLVKSPFDLFELLLKCYPSCFVPCYP